MENTINDRIRKIISDHHKGSANALSKASGVSQSTLKDIIGEKANKPGYDTIIKILKSESDELLGYINADWLLFGKGEMYAKGSDHTIDDLPPIKSESSASEIIIAKEDGTPLLPVEAWGGSLNGSSIAILAEQCKKYNVPISNIDYLIPIAGDSMMPDYCPGDVVAIKKVNEKAFIEWGKVYVLDTCNGVVIKEVQPSENEGCITCVSRNTPTKYKPFEINLCPDNFFGMYAVKGTVRIS